MDDLDRAKDLEMMQRDIALKNTLNRHQDKQQFDEAGNVICIDCAELISPKRLAAKPDAARCVDCKTAHELKLKNGV